jgi:hypothetical protein
MSDPDARGSEVFEWLGFRVSGIPPRTIHRTIVQERACETRAGAEQLLGLAAAHGWLSLRVEEIRRKKK